MSESGFELGLDDPSRAGVFFVASEDLATLDALARDAGLQARRVDLGACRNKATLLLRMATMLGFPDSFGRNWDALSDGLRDLGWLPAGGYALLFDGADELRTGDEAVFDMLLDVLDQASREWAGRGTPFWAFIALPDSAFPADS